MPDENEVQVTVQTLAHFFVAPAVDYLTEYLNPLAGIEQVVTELKARRVRPNVHVIISAPASEIGHDTESRLVRAIDQYCHYRAEYNDREVRAQRRDGSGALAIGVAILAVGFFLSRTARNHLPAGYATEFLADGLFLVVAWVGMWYPLDVLVYYGRPYRRENRVLRELRNGRITLEPRADETPLTD
jgi:hypothetical protein